MRRTSTPTAVRDIASALGAPDAAEKLESAFLQDPLDHVRDVLRLAERRNRLLAALNVLPAREPALSSPGPPGNDGGQCVKYEATSIDLDLSIYDLSGSGRLRSSSCRHTRSTSAAGRWWTNRHANILA
ncbi:hypothetical protein [Amycolatopsis sp. NPDC051061]|uniref:hypothetical protein n=1 Tax=Amycolatopsis sp. NPDC051061 TaxID=3155042 RepID=UPI003425D57E